MLTSPISSPPLRQLFTAHVRCAEAREVEEDLLINDTTICTADFVGRRCDDGGGDDDEVVGGRRQRSEWPHEK